MYLHCKSRKQLAAEYVVNPKTLGRMLKRHDLTLPSGLLTPEWVEKIYQVLGKPTPPSPPPPANHKPVTLSRFVRF